MQQDPAESLRFAINAVGSPGRLAALLGITPQAVSQWRACPIKRVVEVETITGIPRHLLRPDIFVPPPIEPARRRRARP